MILQLDDVKQYLRVENDEEDTLLTGLILQAQEAAEHYCRTTFTEDPPQTVRLAVLLMVSYYFEDRDQSNKTAYETMIRAFHTLLYPNRVPEAMF